MLISIHRYTVKKLAIRILMIFILYTYNTIVSFEYQRTRVSYSEIVIMNKERNFLLRIKIYIHFILSIIFSTYSPPNCFAKFLISRPRRLYLNVYVRSRTVVLVWSAPDWGRPMTNCSKCTSCACVLRKNWTPNVFCRSSISRCVDLIH